MGVSDASRRAGSLGGSSGDVERTSLTRCLPGVTFCRHVELVPGRSGSTPAVVACSCVSTLAVRRTVPPPVPSTATSTRPTTTYVELRASIVHVTGGCAAVRVDGDLEGHVDRGGVRAPRSRRPATARRAGPDPAQPTPPSPAPPGRARPSARGERAVPRGRSSPYRSGGRPAGAWVTAVLPGRQDGSLHRDRPATGGSTRADDLTHGRARDRKDDGDCACCGLIRDEPLRLMCVHAHPDDESSKGAPAMAKYLAEGVEVLVVTCTGGERGDILNPRLKDDPEVLRDITEVRRREMAAAVEILGVQHTWLGFVDSGLPEGDPLPPLPGGMLRARAAAHRRRAPGAAGPRVPPARDDDVRRERRLPPPRPHHVPQGVDGGVRRGRRPRAVPAARRAVAAAEALLQPDLQPVAAGGATTRRCSPTGASRPTPSGSTRWEDREERPVHARIECAEYFDVRDRALLAHATQIDPDGAFFALDHRAAEPRSGRTRTTSSASHLVETEPSRGRPVRRSPAGLARGVQG